METGLALHLEALEALSPNKATVYTQVWKLLLGKDFKIVVHSQ
jgi:hypothetical protein